MEKTMFYSIGTDGIRTAITDAYEFRVMCNFLLYGGTMARLEGEEDMPVCLWLDDHEFQFVHLGNFNGRDVFELSYIIDGAQLSDNIASAKVQICETILSEDIIYMMDNREDSYIMYNIKRVSDSIGCDAIDVCDNSIDFCGRDVVLTFKDGMKMRFSASEFGGIRFEK